jgi:nucleotide-binding universal stress UspA family protein
MSGLRVGLAQSLAGLQALRYAVAEARRRGAALHAVRAWRFQVAWRGVEVDRLRREIAAEELHYAHGVFEAAMGGLPGDVRVLVAAPEGRPDRVLTDLASEWHDVIVVGGRTRRRWLGWLVRGCLRRAGCPVIVVPPPEIARSASPAAMRRRLLRDAERYAATARHRSDPE